MVTQVSRPTRTHTSLGECVKVAIELSDTSNGWSTAESSATEVIIVASAGLCSNIVTRQRPGLDRYDSMRVSSEENVEHRPARPYK